MSGLIGKKKIGRVESPLQQHAKETLSDYVTAVAWSPLGSPLAASSAVGEVILWQGQDSFSTLQPEIGTSVDCLSFSHDGQLLAAGGQDGKVKIWHLPSTELIATLENAPAWVDKIAWSPICNQLAFSNRRYVQIWDADSQSIVTTLNFEASSVLSLAWHPIVEHLAIGGYQGVKIWKGADWDDDPYILAIPSASLTTAWSPDGKYLASGNIDRTIAVIEWGNPHPWVMQGFPGKVRYLAWSDRTTVEGAPLLASATAEYVVVWEKQIFSTESWEGSVLEGHLENVSDLGFQPGTFLLASASEDGRLCLWHSAKRLVKILEGQSEGFSCLAWQPQGQLLAAGKQNGELLVWSKSTQGQGFGRK